MCSVSRSHTDRTCSEIRDRFSTRAEFPQPQPLGLERVRVGGVSASNEIALLLNPDAANPTLARAALSGGAPREVLEHVRDATWAPNGDLVIVRMANGRDRLEYPVGKMLYETAGWISHPRFSKNAFSAALDRGFGSHNTGKRIGSDTQVLLPCAAKLPSRSQQSEQTISATGC